MTSELALPSGATAGEMSMEWRLAAPLAAAVAAGAVRVAYQPKMSLADGTLYAVEALARWHDPELGEITPDRFIPVAEATGMIRPLGASVLAEACRAVTSWNEAHPGRPPVRAAVNVSSVQLDDSAFFGQVVAALEATGMKAENLILEVTESACVGSAAAAMLWRLRGLGLKIAIDDFGTGFSCLSQLARLPADLLKLDSSITQAMVVGERTALVVAAVADLAHALGLGVVAEGIESLEQARLARELGCDLGQGYLFARPLEGPELGNLDGAEDRARKAIATSKDRQAARPPARTVVVVEDDPSSAHLCGYLLKSLGGVRVVITANGEEFSEVMGHTQPDLVLMDLHLPRVSGRELARAIAYGEHGRVVPVIAVTAYPEQIVARGQLDGVFAALISKPIDPPSFVREIETFLEGCPA